MSRITLFRNGVPGRYDECPKGSLCKSMSLDKIEGNYDLYMQVSQDEQSPDWYCIGTFNDTVSQDHIEKEIENCSKLKL